MLQFMSSIRDYWAAVSSSTGEITEDLVWPEKAWVHIHASEGNKEQPVVTGQREWSETLELSQGHSLGEMMDGLPKAQREAHSLHLGACKAGSAYRPSWALHFSETTSVL